MAWLKPAFPAYATHRHTQYGRGGTFVRRTLFAKFLGPSHRQADDGTFWRAAVRAGCCVAVDVAALHSRQGGTPPLVLVEKHQTGLWITHDWTSLLGSDPEPQG